MKRDSDIKSNNNLSKPWDDSIFGFWVESSGEIEFKISPDRSRVRIKIMRVESIAIIEKISLFCGLKSLPKRNNWKGFDFITNLIQENGYLFKDGIVHMPFANRKNIAHITLIDRAKMLLEFSCIENKLHCEFTHYLGSLTLIKRLSRETISISNYFPPPVV